MVGCEEMHPSVNSMRKSSRRQFTILPSLIWLIFHWRIGEESVEECTPCQLENVKDVERIMVLPQYLAWLDNNNLGLCSLGPNEILMRLSSSCQRDDYIYFITCLSKTSKQNTSFISDLMHDIGVLLENIYQGNSLQNSLNGLDFCA